MKRTELRAGLLIAALVFALAGCTSLKQAPSDQTITSDIQAKLFQDPVLKTRDIQVSTQSGVVTLAGSVNTGLEKAAVERFASQEPGVKQVVDQMAVTGTPAAQSAAPEAAVPPETAASAAPPKPARPRKARRHNPSEAASKAEVAAAAPNTADEAEAGPPAVAPDAAAAQPPAPPEGAPAPDQVPPPPVTVTVPAGTVVTVRMVDSVDSSTGQEGQQYAAAVAAPVLVGDQEVVATNSKASVRLVQVKSAGRFEGTPQLALELVSVTAQGAPYSVESSTYQQSGESRGRGTAEKVGGGSLIGGLIGAVAGGGKGAAIGAAIGAGAGAGAQAAGKRAQVKIPSETKIDFTLKTPITITLNP